MKKQNNLPDVVTFSQDDIKKYENAAFIIRDSQERSEGLAQTIAGQLYIVSKKELYKLDDYKTVHEWAMEEFDISKGTVSDAINTFERFGDGITGNIKAEYSDFMFSTLIKMKGLTDDQIIAAGIEPTMSRSQVVDAIKALKVLEDKQKDLPKYEKKWAELYTEFSKHLSFEARHAKLIEIIPDFFDAHKQLTVAEYEKLFEVIEPYVQKHEKCRAEVRSFEEDEFNNKVLPFICEKTGFDSEFVVDGDMTDEDLDRTMEAIKEYRSSVEQEEPEIYEEEPEGYEEEPEGYEEEQEESEEEEMHSFPVQHIRLENYRRENGSIDKKSILADIWEAIQGIENEEHDVLITK